MGANGWMAGIAITAAASIIGTAVRTRRSARRTRSNAASVNPPRGNEGDHATREAGERGRST